MERDTQANGSATREMGMVSKFGLTNHDTKDIGKTIKRMGRAHCIMQMATFILGIGRMIKLMAGESTHMTMEQRMRVNGKKTNKMAKVLKHGLMVLSILASIKMVKNMEKEFFILQIEVCMKDPFLRMRFLVKVFIHGMMAKNMRVNGNKTKWTAREGLNGQMVKNMKVILKMINAMAKGSFDGKMAKFIKALG